MAETTRRVLVVHATSVTAQTAQRALRRAGFEPILTDDPERATWIAAELQPDAVLLDLAIASCDVLDVASALRGHARTRAMPLVALATGAARDAITYAISRGCDDVLDPTRDAGALGRAIGRLTQKRAA